MSKVHCPLETSAYLHKLLLGFETQQTAVSGQCIIPWHIIQYLLLRRFVCV